MNRERLRNRALGAAKLIGLCILSLMILFGSVKAFGDESVTVVCYAGNLRVGSVVIFDVTTAALACNSMYYDCRGRCLGCFIDFDYTEDVCVDMKGNMFLR